MTTTKPAGYPPTPELDKMLAITDKSQVIGEFLEWLFSEHNVRFMRWNSEEEPTPCTHHPKSRHEERKIDVQRLKAELEGAAFDAPSEGHPVTCRCGGTGVITTYHEGWEDVRPSQSGGTIQAWLADYFEINLATIENERSAVLDWVRENNG